MCQSQLFMVKIMHVSHLPRQVVLSRWLRRVEEVEGQEGPYSRMMREKLVIILREMVD